MKKHLSENLTTIVSCFNKHNLRKLLFIIASFFSVQSVLAQNQTFTASGNFTVPAGVTTITIEAWGAGGGGGAATGNPAGGGGGAGGSYARKVLTVTPGQVIPVVVGTGGASATAGGNTYMLNTSTILAQGGAAGGSAAANSTSGTGGVGSSGSSIGDLVRAGGNGGTGAAGTTAGGGGQGGGISAQGNAGTTAIGGRGSDDAGPGGLFDGGNGGNPGGNNAAGGNGVAPGGAGGGGRAGTTTDRLGGNGARGEIRVHWCTNAPPAATMTSFQNRQDPADIDLSICPGTLIGGGGENDLEIFDNAAANSYVTNGYQFLWEVSSSFDNGLTFSAYAPAANGVFPNSGIAGTQTAGNPYYNTDTQYPFYSYFNTNGVYKFRLKMTNACGSTYSAGTGGVISVTVGGVIATASANPNPDVICNNQTLTLSGASVGGGALNGQWSVFSSTGTGTAPNNTNLSNTSMQNNAGIASTVFTPPAGFSGTVTLRLTTEVVAAVCPGGVASSSFSDRVVQVGALPTVTCPTDITTASCTVTSVNYIATFTGNPTVTYSIASGSNFPVGATTPVTVTAENGCATVSCTFNVTVPGDNSITPTFTGLNPTYSFCAGSTAPILPTSSTNSPVINGNWFVGAVQTPVVENMVVGTTTYTFVPGAGQCAQQYSISVTINALPIVTIDGLTASYCKDAPSVTLAGTPAGGAFTIDGNSATSFDPALLSAGPHTVVYSVTDVNTCSNSVSTTVTVNALPVVSFPGTFSDQCNTLTTFALTGGDPAGGVYSGSGVAGTNFDASTATLGANTIAYTFTDANSCSNSATNIITVVNCTTVAGSVVGTGIAPATVAGTNVPDASAYVSLLDNANAILQTKEVIGGGYSFAPVIDGTYKVILHNLAGGSATPIFPNGYEAFRIEGAIGSAGDNNPNGIIEITLPSGTIASGAKLAAGTVDASFGVQAGPLPIRLISFSGKATEQGNELSWKTSQEQNFSHYEIERSVDSKSFKNIGKVLGAGNSKENLNYTFIDNSNSAGVVPGTITNQTAFDGNSYYRLKMIDIDGSHEYSKIIFIKNENSEVEIGNFYPNPAFGNEVSIQIKSSERSTWNITSYDLSGKIIQVETRLLEKGDNNLKLDISRIQSKNTIFRFENGGRVVYRKLNN